jgi:hypothetical protein
MKRFFVLICGILFSLPFTAQNTTQGVTQNSSKSEIPTKTWDLYGFIPQLKMQDGNFGFNG